MTPSNVREGGNRALFAERRRERANAVACVREARVRAEHAELRAQHEKVEALGTLIGVGDERRRRQLGQRSGVGQRFGFALPRLACAEAFDESAMWAHEHVVLAHPGDDRLQSLGEPCPQIPLGGGDGGAGSGGAAGGIRSVDLDDEREARVEEAAVQ